MNISKLKGKIREKDKTYADCAIVVGISKTAFSNKMNGISKFYVEEIQMLSEYLEMNLQERLEIFF